MSFRAKIFYGFLASVLLAIAMATTGVISQSWLTTRLEQSKWAIANKMGEDAASIVVRSKISELARAIERPASSVELNRAQFDAQIDTASAKVEDQEMRENVRVQLSQLLLSRQNFMEAKEALPRMLADLNKSCEKLVRVGASRIASLAQSNGAEGGRTKQLENAHKAFYSLVASLQGLFSQGSHTVAFVDDDAMYADFEKELQEVTIAFQKYMESLSDSLDGLEGGPEVYAEIEALAFETMLPVVDDEGLSRSLEQLVIKSNSVDATRLNLYETLDELQSKTVESSEHMVELFKDSFDELINHSKSLQKILVAGGVIAAILSIVLGILIPKKISTSIERITARIEAVSERVGKASKELRSTSKTIADGAAEQASSLEETYASLQELNKQASRNAKGAKKTASAAEESKQSVSEGVEEITEMVCAMGEIESSSSEISKIIDTIEEIAFQTNILALNAAVEAARAGAAGTGFSVVADEVRNLAQRSSKAANESSKRIAYATSSTKKGVEISNRLKQRLEKISDQIQQTDKFVNEVSSSSENQNVGVSQILESVSFIDKVTQKSVQSSNDAATSSKSLEALAGGLGQAVSELGTLLRGERKSGKRNSVRGKKLARRTQKVITEKVMAEATDKGNEHSLTIGRN